MSNANTVWFTPQKEPVKAVAIVVHGLNLKPERMDQIATLLKDNQIETLRLTLTGHGATPDDFGEISRSQWLKDTQKAYNKARKRADILKVPLYFVGFSLGALVNMDLMAHNPKVKYDRVVLFAPAIRLRIYTWAVKVLYLFGNDFITHSIAPDGYRAHKGVCVAALRALFDSIEALQRSSIQHTNIPTLVMVHILDELVSKRGIRAMCKQHRLHNWQIISLGSLKPMTGPKYHHLIIDENSVGSLRWKKITTTMLDFLSNE